jgi:hypothetical protein
LGPGPVPGHAHLVRGLRGLAKHLIVPPNVSPFLSHPHPPVETYVNVAF